MKTAVSIPDEVFEDLRRVAEEHNVSRSKVITEALRDYIGKWNDRKLLAALNDAYSDVESVREKNLRKQAKKYYGRKVLKDRW